MDNMWFIYIYFNFLLIMCVLIKLAFFILMECSVLLYIQIPKRPNKVVFLGIPQPFSDAIKLVFKE